MSSQQPVRTRRLRALAVVVLVAVAATVASLVTAHFVRSPAQAAADTSPPPPTRLTAPVTKGPVISTLALSGTVQPQFQVTAPLSSGDSAAPARTALKVGDAVESGRVAAQSGDRPVILLPGAQPLVRSLVPGSSGPDVEQLRAALASLGYATSDPSATFGASTKTAVAALYRDRGFLAKEVNAEEATSAQAAVTAAERAYESAKITHDRAKRDASKAPNSDAVDDALRALNNARSDLGDARDKLARARASTGPSVTLGEAVFVPALPATVTKLASRPDGGLSALTFAAGPAVVGSDLSEQELGKVKPKQKVTVMLRSGENLPCEVQSIGPPPATEASVPGQQQPLAAAVASVACADPQRLVAGDLVRTAIVVSEEPGPFLLVPQTAVVTRADGQTLVISAAGNAEIAVKLGPSGDGLVAITPTTPGGIHDGDQVVLGRG